MDDTLPLFSQALELLLAGMGTVFGFLVLLVIATRVMSWLVLRTLPRSALGDGPSQFGPTTEELAAAAAAVHRYRREHSNQPRR